MPHLFEFMDLHWLPETLRATLREILECGNSWPFRGYYAWVAEEVLRAAEESGVTTLVEMGAGTAPVTRLLAADPRTCGMLLVPSDRHPDLPAYEALARRYPDKVVPCKEPVEYSRPQDWPPNALLYLSATFHHILPEQRHDVLLTLTKSAKRVIVFEPLRKTTSSMLFVFASIVPALIVPAWLILRPGRFRRFLWCWLVPVAPVLFLWEGAVSCLRMWSDQEWRHALGPLLPAGRSFTILSTVFCQEVTW